MITFSRLGETTEDALADINALLPQLRADPSQRKGPLSDLRSIIDNKWTRLIVARDGGRIIGMVTLHIVNNVGKRIGHVDDVVVDHAYREQGVGTKLMLELIGTAKAEGVNQLKLTSRPARVAANRLYQRLGFKIASTNVYGMKL